MQPHTEHHTVIKPVYDDSIGNHHKALLIEEGSQLVKRTPGHSQRLDIQKQSQIKFVCHYLTHDPLQALVESFHCLLENR